jgi:hypothetical protein
MGERFQWTPLMREVSGFGGQYEQACRLAIRAGVEFLDSHPGEKPEFQMVKGVLGIAVPHNEIAKALAKAMAQSVSDFGGLTCIMLHTCLDHVKWINLCGWDVYEVEMCKPATDERPS